MCRVCATGRSAVRVAPACSRCDAGCAAGRGLTCQADAQRVWGMRGGGGTGQSVSSPRRLEMDSAGTDVLIDSGGDAKRCHRGDGRAVLYAT